MDEEDYKAIADVFKAQMSMADTMSQIGKLDILRIAEGLADYFEKIYNKDKYSYCPDVNCACITGYQEKFDKERFMKNCGVKE